AVLMTRRVVEQVLAWKSDGAGWDIHLRNWTLHTGTKIHTLIPNPVQHRGVPHSRPNAAAAWAGPLPTTGPSKGETGDPTGARLRRPAPAARRTGSHPAVRAADRPQRVAGPEEGVGGGRPRRGGGPRPRHRLAHHHP